jgi:hypothetical protein
LSAVQAIPANSILTRQLACPAGKRSLSAGYQITAPVTLGLRLANRVVESYPDTVSTWTLTIYNGSFENGSFTLYIICATAL